MPEVITEEWRPILGYEGLYEVSDAGRVRSIARVKSAKIMALGDSRGYKNVELWKDGIGKRFTVHRLVCLSFIGPRPDGFDINHRNGVKADNSLKNLEYVTKSQNRKHAFALGLQCNKGTNHSQHKLKDDDIKTIRNMLAEGFSQKQIANHFSVDQSNISFIKTGRLWSHIP